MRKLTLLLLITLGGCSPNRVALITQPNRVLYTSTDINQISTIDSITRIRSSGFLTAKNLKFTLRNGERKTIPKKTIWGYSDRKGNVWRCFKNTNYQVLSIKDVVEYETTEPRTVGPSMVIYEPIRKYSKTLDSRIVGSRKRAIRIGEGSETK